jgi:hypothetical protein
MNGTASRAATLLLTAFVAACGRHHPPGPALPSGATVVPTSQQKAQDTVLGYLKKTLQASPIRAGTGTCANATDSAKPNRFGSAPDGYSLQIVAARHNKSPPTIAGASPCFPEEPVRDDIRVPAVLKADS